MSSSVGAVEISGDHGVFMMRHLLELTKGLKDLEIRAAWPICTIGIRDGLFKSVCFMQLQSAVCSVSDRATGHRHLFSHYRPTPFVFQMLFSHRRTEQTLEHDYVNNQYVEHLDHST